MGTLLLLSHTPGRLLGLIRARGQSKGIYNTSSLVLSIAICHYRHKTGTTLELQYNRGRNQNGKGDKDYSLKARC